LFLDHAAPKAMPTPVPTVTPTAKWPSATPIAAPMPDQLPFLVPSRLVDSDLFKPFNIYNGYRMGENIKSHCDKIGIIIVSFNS